MYAFGGAKLYEEPMNEYCRPKILHYIGKDKTQRLERTNGIVRQQTGRWLSLRHATRTQTEQVWQSMGINESDDPYALGGA